MRVKIQKSDLLQLIGKTQHIVEKKTTMPVLVNVLLEAEGQKLVVYTTDLEISIIDKSKAEITTSGKIAINSRSLFEIAKELSEGPIELSRAENNWLEIKQGKFQSRIVGVSPEEYPVFPTFSGMGLFAVPVEVLQDMIEKTIYSVSNDETRYHLNGVYFERHQDNNYSMVATDGHRLSLITKNIPSLDPHGIGPGVIIPRKGLIELKKILEGNHVGEFQLGVEGSQLIVRKEDFVLMIRLIEGKYPNYSQFIPKSVSNRARIHRESFLTSLRRVSLLANQKTKVVLLQLSKGKMEISSHNPDFGDAREEMEVDYHGKNLSIGFNARYIQDALSAMSEEEIDLEFNDQQSPSLVKPHGVGTYTCVVMPMRI